MQEEQCSRASEAHGMHRLLTGALLTAKTHSIAFLSYDTDMGNLN